jgi:hypothetical protein
MIHASKVPFTTRKKWHQPKDKWEVIFRHAWGVCKRVSYITRPRWLYINEWAYGLHKGSVTDGPVLKKSATIEASKASLRRIPAPTKKKAKK